VRDADIVVARKMDASILRLINKYDSMISEYHIQNIAEIESLTEKALEEGNGIIILQEYLGYYVVVFKNGGFEVLKES
jgi:glutathione synthase/RimK-type ligase-like ATP-grasp enzyme